jgi:hypothetical protein
MDTDLDGVARDPRVGDVEFFRRLPKTRVESPIGTTLTPNFYYRMSSARLTMLARTRSIRTRLPGDLTPLEIAPGVGLISVLFFRYDVCDIDFYTEAAVGIAVRPARHDRPGGQRHRRDRCCPVRGHARPDYPPERAAGLHAHLLHLGQRRPAGDVEPDPPAPRGQRAVPP